MVEAIELRKQGRVVSQFTPSILKQVFQPLRQRRLGGNYGIPKHFNKNGGFHELLNHTQQHQKRVGRNKYRVLNRRRHVGPT